MKPNSFLEFLMNCNKNDIVHIGIVFSSDVFRKTTYCFSVLFFLVLMSSADVQSQNNDFKKGLNKLVPNEDLGPVEQWEIDLFDTYFTENFFPNIPENNNEKVMTWDVSTMINTLVVMYETTGDVKYIEYAENCSDIILNAKRSGLNDWLDYPTGREIKGWPYYYWQFTKGEENIKSEEESNETDYIPAVYNSIVGNGCIIRALSRVARIIKQDNLAAVHQVKAERYINSCVETIDSFVRNGDEWYDEDLELFRFPNTEENDNCLNNTGGLISAHNRQLTFAVGMLNVQQYYKLKGEKEDLQEDYKSIIKSVSKYFWRSCIEKENDDGVYYAWNYREEKKDDKDPKPEDMAHGGVDVQCAVQIYKDLGVSSISLSKSENGALNFEYIANTLLNIMYDEGHENFSKRIDGSFDDDKNTEKDKYNARSIRWIALSGWDERVFDNAHRQLIDKMKIKDALPYCEYLFYKSERYGRALSTNDNVNFDTSVIVFYPNPSSDEIRLLFDNEQGQIKQISILDLASGSLYKTIFNEFQPKSVLNNPFDISFLSSGNYLIRIQTQDALVYKKLIKI